MIDYSFIRLKDNLTSALDINDSPVTTHFFYNPIQLIPTKSYLQITNFEGGISLDSDCEVFVIDCNDNVLADITNSVFIEEFTDSNGNNQCKIELINLGVDFYRNTVLLKFAMLSSNAVFYSNPINITAYQSERTVFFKYRNYDDYAGIGYTNANAWQSISLSMYYDIDIDETETEDYFQISKNNTISARALEKVFEQYKIEQINSFTFKRLNKLLKHDLIYIDNVRVTNKPVVSSEERQGDSSVFATEVALSKDYNDRSPYEYQVFQGFQLIEKTPSGVYSDSNYPNKLKGGFNYPITIGTGTITVYNSSDDSVIATYNQDNLTLDNSTTFIVLAFENEISSNGNYYIQFDSGLIKYQGLDFKGVNDTTSWSFSLVEGEYDSTEYLNTEYLTT